jgi:two-component system, cell cycle sensor histidine kinase and response regulator CckA
MTASPRQRILLIEDNPRDAELVRYALRQGGLQSDLIVVQGRAELQQRLQEPFSAIIADYRLPDLSLITAMEEARSRFPDVPFVVISGSTSEEQLLAALRLGADDYLLKDRLARLAAAVTGAIEKHRLRSERASAEADVQAKQEQLLHAQRVESIGRLAGGILHDFNNLITVVLGNTTLALDGIGHNHPSAHLLDQVVAASQRAAELTHQLLAFSRRQSEPRQSLDLSEVVSSFAPLAQQMLGPNRQLQTALATSLPPIHADRVQIEQVLMNLLLNARDATPNGGTVTVNSDRVTVDGREFVRLRVQDSGIGMSPEILDRVFDPYFTTKPVGAGTGLGLSTTMAIVHHAGGSISVRSAPQQGTEFEVRLPVAAAASNTTTSTPNLAANAQSILVVDEEPLVRSMLESVLRKAGYAVTSTASLPEATRIVNEARPIDLIVADASRSGHAEEPATASLTRLRPGTPVLLLTEHGARSPVPDASRLEKPFSPQELLAAIEMTMRSGR